MTDKPNTVDLTEEMAKMITSDDINRYLHKGGDEILKYSELSRYENINELLPSNGTYKIILIETNYNVGHWCCILRYGKTIEWFDSYGIVPDGELKFVSAIKKKLLGEDHKYLTNLLASATKQGFHVIYNKKKLQKVKNGVNTCGRWVLLRITMMKDMLYDLPEFLAFVKKSLEGGELSRDELITQWVK